MSTCKQELQLSSTTSFDHIHGFILHIYDIINVFSNVKEYVEHMM